MLCHCVGALFSHLAIWTLVETIDTARQRALCSHQTGCLPPEVLETPVEESKYWLHCGLKCTTSCVQYIYELVEGTAQRHSDR